MKKNLRILREAERFFQENAHKAAVATKSEVAGSREVKVKLNKTVEVLHLPVFLRRGAYKFPFSKKTIRRISKVLNTCTTPHEVITAMLNNRFAQADIYEELIANQTKRHKQYNLLMVFILCVIVTTIIYYCFVL